MNGQQITVNVAVNSPDQPDKAEQEAKGLYSKTYAAESLPDYDEPEDEDMRAVRSDWRLFPAEVEKAVGADVFDEAIDTTVEIDGRPTKVTREMLGKSVAEFRALVGDLGLNADQASYLLSEIKRLGAMKDRGEEDPLPKRESAVELLNGEHGGNASLSLRAARAYIEKNPKLGRLLDRSGLGDDPKVVAMVARRALSLHQAGKLKVK